MARNLWLTVVSAVIASTTCALAQTADDFREAAKWSPWLELGGFYGSNDSSRGEAVLWVPLAQGTTSLLFGEMRGKLFEDDMREGNFALGYRRMMPGGWNLGAWGGYDIRESKYGSTFHQIAGGIEALSDRWDVRANAYLPLDDTKTLFNTSSFVPTGVLGIDFTGTSIGLATSGILTTTSMAEFALWGIDAEIGAKLFSTPVDLPGPRHELRLYAGAYHFDHSNLPDSVTGPRLRAEWRMDEIIDAWEGSRLTFEGEYSHDDLRDDRFEVGARLRLPFGDTGTRLASRSLSAQERRMTEGLERDTDIVTDTKTTTSSTTSTVTEAVEDARTGVRFDKVVTIDATDDLSTESAAAGGNTLIIADGTAGSFGGSEDDLQGNQTLMGGGSTIEVRGRQSGVVASFTASGAAPALFSYSITTHLNVTASNTHVTGLTFDGNSDAQQLIDLQSGVQNVLISNATLRNSALFNYAIHVWSGAEATIDGVDIHDVDRGIQLHGATAVVTNTNIDADYLGVSVLGASSLDMSNSTISGTLSHAGLTVATGSTVSGHGNTGGPNFTCFSGGAGWTGSVEFNGVAYTYATNCN